MAVATALNFLIIKKKLTNNQVQFALLDIAIAAILLIFASPIDGGLVVASIISAISSIYFLGKPPIFLIDSIKRELDVEPT